MLSIFSQKRKGQSGNNEKQVRNDQHRLWRAVVETHVRRKGYAYTCTCFYKLPVYLFTNIRCVDIPEHKYTESLFT